MTVCLQDGPYMFDAMAPARSALLRRVADQPPGGPVASLPCKRDDAAAWENATSLTKPEDLGRVLRVRTMPLCRLWPRRALRNKQLCLLYHPVDCW